MDDLVMMIIDDINKTVNFEAMFDSRNMCIVVRLSPQAAYATGSSGRIAVIDLKELKNGVVCIANELKWYFTDDNRVYRRMRLDNYDDNFIIRTLNEFAGL